MEHTPSTAALPSEFIQWAFTERARLIERQAFGEKIPDYEIFLGFCRHTPAVVSNGPAGLNASIKGVGFLPKPEAAAGVLEEYLRHIASGWSEQYGMQGLQLLVKLLYGPGCQEHIDFTRFGTLELARDHTWTNLQADPRATLLFYQPPMISYEVRGHVEIHQEGSLYHRLLNAQHDVYHKPNPARWPERPAYVFIIEEIFNNSVGPKGFGKKVFG